MSNPDIIENIIDSLPDYAKDLRLNYSKVKTEAVLDDKQLYGCLMVGALISNSEGLISFIKKECNGLFVDEEIKSIYAAYSIMSMNVIYYRFTHMAKGNNYATMPTNLRMHAMGSSIVSKINFEMWCLAASIILGCEKCINAHENELKSEGVTSLQIQAIARVSAIISAIGSVVKTQD